MLNISHFIAVLLKSGSQLSKNLNFKNFLKNNLLPEKKKTTCENTEIKILDRDFFPFIFKS